MLLATGQLVAGLAGGDGWTSLFERRLDLGFKRRLLVGAGALFTALGIIGILVPFLPTTPFLLLAAACFGRSSPTAYRWLVNNRYFGTYLRNYWEGKGIPLLAKIVAVTVLWLTIGLSTMVLPLLAIKVMLMLIGLAVAIHLVLLPTTSSQREANRQAQEESGTDGCQAGKSPFG